MTHSSREFQRRLSIAERLLRGTGIALIAYGLLLVLWVGIVTYTGLMSWPWWLPIAAAAVYLSGGIPLANKLALGSLPPRPSPSGQAASHRGLTNRDPSHQGSEPDASHHPHRL